MKQIKSLFSWLLHHGLHFRVMLGIVLPIVLVIGAFSYIDYTRRQENTISTLSMFSTHIGEVIQNNLRHQMLESDFEALEELLITVGQLEGVNTVHLLNLEGEIIFSSQQNLIGTQVNTNQPDCMACHTFDLAERPTSAIVSLPEGARVFRSAQPIDNEEICQSCHEEQPAHLGLLLTDLAIAPYEVTLIRDTRDHFLWWSAALFLTLGVVGLVFNRFVLHRLNAFGSQITNIGEGEQFTRLVDRPRDEIGRIAAAFNKMAEQVEEREAENNRLSRSLRIQNEQRGQLLNRLISAQETERIRVAQDLHDELGQAMSGLALQAQAVKRLITEQPAQADKHLTEMSSVIKDTTDKMYSMILDLRPSVLDDLGLIPALRGHADRVFHQTGISFTLHNDDHIMRLPANLETTLYRVFQEALNNVVRHASATEVEINLRRSDGHIVGEVMDNGCGFELDSVDLSGDSPRGLGILGMKERIAQVGGKLDVISQSGKGTRIQVRIEI